MAIEYEEHRLTPTLIKGFLDPEHCNALYALARLDDDEPNYYFKEDDTNAKYRSTLSTRGETWERYGPLWGEALSLSHLRKVEAAAGGVNLTPTYSFIRWYWEGAYLIPHIDRCECEYTVTIALAYDTKDASLFWVEHEGERFEFELAQGDAVVYQGFRDKHAREKAKGWYLGLMLHYINTNGRYFKNAYDRRPGTRKLYEPVINDFYERGGGAS